MKIAVVFGSHFINALADKLDEFIAYQGKTRNFSFSFPILFYAGEDGEYLFANPYGIAR